MSNDYGKQNLAGKSFRDQNLSGSNFSGADIYGADFTKANLTGANFSEVKTGQQLHWKFGLIVLLILLAFVTGLIIGFAGGVWGNLMMGVENQPTAFWLGMAALIFLLIICSVVVIKGFGFELGFLSVASVVAIIVIAVVYPGDDNAAGIVLANGFFLLFAIVGIISGAVLSSIVLSASRILAGNRAILFFLIIIVLSCAFGVYKAVVLEEGSPERLKFSEELARLKLSEELYDKYVIQGIAISGTVSIALIGLGIFITNRVFGEDKPYTFIRKIVRELTSFRGTNFREANLTDANFEKAIVKSADFRGAKLKNTNWSESRFLEYSRFEKTNLEDSRLRKLVVTKKAPGENFDRLDLLGLNLEGANLKQASFIGADLNETNLKGTDLTLAKLVNTQLHKTDLTGATLTGAFIQDWGISTSTKFEGVKCDYLFMRLPTKDNPEPWRKPDKEKETFQEGDFEKFITPIIKTLGYYASQDSEPHKTLDIFHNKGVDPNAFAVAIQQFTKENPEADLEVIAVEGKDEDKLRLQAKISSEVDGEELKGKYLKLYEEIKSKPGANIQNLIHENEAIKNHIKILEEWAKTALRQKNVTISSNTARIFVSYSHRDKSFVEELHSNLTLLRRQGLISIWDDSEITAGAEWSQVIDQRLESADIIILLVSSDFLASDFCWSVELKKAMERHEEKKSLIIPVIVRPCEWSEAPFSRLQILPSGGKPISTFPDTDEAWLDVATSIRKAVQQLNEGSRSFL